MILSEIIQYLEKVHAFFMLKFKKPAVVQNHMVLDNFMATSLPNGKQEDLATDGATGSTRHDITWFIHHKRAVTSFCRLCKKWKIS